jgi:hypothetical protein
MLIVPFFLSNFFFFFLPVLVLGKSGNYSSQ